MELERALATLLALLSCLSFFESEVERLMREVVFPRVWLHVPQLNAEIANGLDGGAALEEFRAGVPGASRFEEDYLSLMGDLEFENALVERTTLLIITRRSDEEFVDELRGVLRLLDGA